MFTTSTDSIIASFNKTISKLYAHHHKSLERADDSTAASMQHAEVAKGHQMEAARAFAIATKLEGIIN